MNTHQTPWRVVEESTPGHNVGEILDANGGFVGYVPDPEDAKLICESVNRQMWWEE